jgi:hypothetical protein
VNIIQFNRSALNQDVCQTLDLSRIPHNNLDGSVVTAVHCCAALGLSHLFGEIENHYVITECRQLVRRSIEVSLGGVTAVADGDPVIEAQVIGCANVRTATAARTTIFLTVNP